MKQTFDTMHSDNLLIYNTFRSPPKEALKEIGAGRLKGFTDINPMWRIKALTEQFGPCGIGWYFGEVHAWTESGAGETAAFVELNLYVKNDSEWSKPIYGIGGSRLVAIEKGATRLDDECYKKAYSDAIGVSCKALGMAADVYYEKDSTKYSQIPAEGLPAPKPAMPQGKEAQQAADAAKKIAERKEALKEVASRNSIKFAALIAIKKRLEADGYISNKAYNELEEPEFIDLLAVLSQAIQDEKYQETERQEAV